MLEGGHDVCVMKVYSYHLGYGVTLVYESVRVLGQYKPSH